MNEAMIAEPPYDMNGNGMPVIGMMPIVIPMFSKTWNAKIAEHADREQRAEEIGRQQRGPPEPPHQQPVEPDQRRAADEAELLTHHREDEVGVLLGHVAEVGLAALEQPVAREAAV